MTKPSTASSLRCYARLPLFLEDKVSSAYINNFFCYIMSKVDEWCAASQCKVRKRLTWRILSTCSQAVSTAPNGERCQGVSAIPASKSGPALATSPLVSTVQALCGLPCVLPGCFHFTSESRPPMLGSPKRWTSYMAKISTPKHRRRQSV